MKRAIAKLLTVSIGLVFLIGCGGGGGESSASSRGTALTIEEGFPSFGTTATVKGALREHALRGVSQSEADRFEKSLQQKSFTLHSNGQYYKYNIPYAGKTYNASAAVEHVIYGEYLVILRVENDYGDVVTAHINAGLFDYIFGPVNGWIFSANADKSLAGDQTLELETYQLKLKSNQWGFKKDSSSGRWVRSRNGFTYTWSGSVSKSCATCIPFTHLFWFIDEMP
jgi:Rieske Fe-S protein